MVEGTISLSPGQDIMEGLTAGSREAFLYRDRSMLSAVMDVGGDGGDAEIA